MGFINSYLIFIVFNLIFYANLIGLLPYTFTFTANIFFTFNLALFLLFTAIANGLRLYRYALFGLFLPSGTPLILALFIIIIELLAYLTRISSLGIRLTVNIITGHTLILVVNGFHIVAGSILIMLIMLLPLILELLIAYLQAYILTFIATITLKDFLFSILAIGFPSTFIWLFMAFNRISNYSYSTGIGS